MVATTKLQKKKKMRSRHGSTCCLPLSKKLKHYSAEESNTEQNSAKCNALQCYGIAYCLTYIFCAFHFLFYDIWRTWLNSVNKIPFVTTYNKTATQHNPTKHNSKSGDKVLFLIYFNSTPNASECAAADRCDWVAGTAKNFIIFLYEVKQETQLVSGIICEQLTCYQLILFKYNFITFIF